MPVLHNCAQRSERWNRLRLGIATSSEFSRIWTPPQKTTATGRAPQYPLGRESDQWEAYAHKLIYERKTGLEDEDPQYRSPWMERGADIEQDAIQWYELINDVETFPIGFITTDDGKLGCSPDRLAGDEGLIEFKSPRGGTHIGYFLKGSPEPLSRELALRALDHKYWVQLQGQLYVSQRQWVDIVSYHPRLVDMKVCIRVTQDADYIGALSTALMSFNHYLDTVSARLCADWAERKLASLNALPQDRGALHRALRASLEGGP